jgi:hypothetical protein
MPIPNPNKDEDKNSFVSRCMSDEKMKSEYKDNDQRVAICLTQFRRKNPKASVFNEDGKIVLDITRDE